MSDPLIHKDSLRGFVISALLASRLSDSDETVAARVALLMELDAAFNLQVDKMSFADRQLIIKGIK